MKIHELLNDKSKWIKGAYARDSKGKATTSSDLNAVCWCLQGALLKVYEGLDDYLKVSMKLRNVILKETPYATITTFNDNSDYETVYKLIKELDI